jgi:hypothetical protein
MKLAYRGHSGFLIFLPSLLPGCLLLKHMILKILVTLDLLLEVKMKHCLMWRAHPFVHDLASGIKTVSRIFVNSV